MKTLLIILLFLSMYLFTQGRLIKEDEEGVIQNNKKTYLIRGLLFFGMVLILLLLKGAYTEV